VVPCTIRCVHVGGQRELRDGWSSSSCCIMGALGLLCVLASFLIPRPGAEVNPGRRPWTRCTLGRRAAVPHHRLDFLYGRRGRLPDSFSSLECSVPSGPSFWVGSYAGQEQ